MKNQDVRHPSSSRQMWKAKGDPQTVNRRLQELIAKTQSDEPQESDLHPLKSINVPCQVLLRNLSGQEWLVETAPCKMANNGSYSNDRSSASADIDYATDPASGSFFNSDYKKHEDLKQMLDVNKDSLKLEAMKRIIGMVAKGRDASDLFPAVVKNVVSKNIEVKKLVYVYLVRYAEEQQDLALLSISTFQRALKDPNQLIRASALRVLSSIRVPVIVPIVMLAIKDSASDMSPYVRKTAAHAIPKLYSLDPDQKEELILVIEKLLSDRTTLVVGSAVMAFEEDITKVYNNVNKL
ncbi:AP-3 complex subunit beta-2 [Homalodisca vitripennis]|nr:AP-3 complex subunit beta-2 [Homalodisca vitripennis]